MACYNCRTTDSAYYAEENGYTLIKCAGCGLVYLKNPPGLSEITQAHVQGLHHGEKTIQTTGKYNPAAIKRYRRVLRDLFPAGFYDNCSWLDIGCGHGEFIEALTQAGPNSLHIVGSEPNIHKQHSASARGLDVSFIDLDSHERFYNGVSLLNVYSHLPDPPAFLAKIRNILAPDGELLLETGDTARFSAADHYRPFYLPDHISFASEEIVTDILRRVGFEIVAVRKYPHPDVELSPVRLGKELIKVFLPHMKSRLTTLFSDACKYSATDMYIRARKISA